MKGLPESLRKALAAQRLAAKKRQEVEQAWLKAMRNELQMSVRLMQVRQRLEDKQFGELERYFKALVALKVEEIQHIERRRKPIQRRSPNEEISNA